MCPRIVRRARRARVSSDRVLRPTDLLVRREYPRTVLTGGEVRAEGGVGLGTVSRVRDPQGSPGADPYSTGLIDTAPPPQAHPTGWSFGDTSLPLSVTML